MAAHREKRRYCRKRIEYPRLDKKRIIQAIRRCPQRPSSVSSRGSSQTERCLDQARRRDNPRPNRARRSTRSHGESRDDGLILCRIRFYWGDWHREETWGPVRADRISPTRSALDRKVVFTLHTDMPVVPPNMISTRWSATTRRSRSGDILGPAQRLDAWEALSAITLQATCQSGNESLKVSIEVGKQADLVVLSTDPLGVEQKNLRDLPVLETIARGRQVWPAP